MKEIDIKNLHSPCMKCLQKGILFDKKSNYCKQCEYNFAIQVLKKVFRIRNGCALCRMSVPLGDESFVCGKRQYELCIQNNLFEIAWDKIINEYGG